SSQPNRAGTELEKYYNLGLVFEWFWKCPKCGEFQPFRWWHQRSDSTFAGVNWDTVLNADGESTNIALSAKTAWLECHPCRFKVADTLETRRELNETGNYVCIKPDGDPS